MTLAKLTVELTNLCNLDCDYCFKEFGTSHLDIDLLRRVLAEARALGARKVTYTGGEISLYPHLKAALAATVEFGYKFSLVSNGWHFPKVVPLLKEARSALKCLFFSFDGATADHHDAVRGAGSFRRLMSALSLCKAHGFPFAWNVVVNSRTVGEMERLAVLAARLGAEGVLFGHVLPTSADYDARLSLTPMQRREAEREAAALGRILSIPITFSATAAHFSPDPPCETLGGRTLNIDCRGNMTLCCQLASYRGAGGTPDHIADLAGTNLASAYSDFARMVDRQLTRRNEALAEGDEAALFPCHFCISTLYKTPWQSGLPVLATGGING